ncbi:MAG: ArgR family transcriptional regulator [Dysgonamonadaceae bacterium]|jgi:transcriptional regulator of arginine metabolism|nr:ArgR family transcriptional regulator [Dysgonamonadaceae bacterium]
MKSKKDRHSAIQDIILKQSVGSQEELLNILKDRGFNSTQATLSRDVKALKIIKSPDLFGNYVYTLPTGSRIQTGIFMSDNTPHNPSGFISIDFSGNLAVIKTRPGYAMGIASDIDSKAGSEILGTIAGDDTILIIPREGISRRKIVEALSVSISTELS